METQGPLVDESQPHEPDRTDLNRATADELIALPGIGLALARRIIAHREAHGPFTSVSDLTNVTGIGQTVLEGIADLVSVVPGATALSPGHNRTGATRSTGWDLGDADPDQKGTAGPDGTAEPEQIEEAAAMTDSESPVEAAEHVPDVPGLQGEAAMIEVEPGVHSPDEEIKEPPLAGPALPPVQEPSRRRSWSWVWASVLGAVLGGLLGLVLALLVFAGINGSVDVRRSSAFRTLNNQVNGLGVEIDTVRTDVSTLQGDLDGLRQRVEVLSGLTARMDKAESTIGAFGEDIDTLQTAVSAMTQEIDDLGQAVDTLELQSAQTLSFFEQLRALLEEMFGGKEPQGAIPSPEGVN